MFSFEQYSNNYRNAQGIMSQCCQIRWTMWLPPSSATYSDPIRHWSLNYWWIFLSVYPIHMTLLLKDLRCFHIALSSYRVSFSWCPKLHNQVNSLLLKDVSSAFQVITAINSHTIFYKEQQAFSNLCIFVFENVIV